MEQQAEGGVAHCGRHFEAAEVELIVDVVIRFGRLSRTELAATICELLNWQRDHGGLKTRECLDLLEKLEARGLFTLPARRRGRPRNRQTTVPHTERGHPQAPVVGELGEVTPVGLELVEGDAAHALWRELVGRYHYLGYATAFGAQLRYFARVQRPRAAIIGCLQYSSAAWRLRERDRWIGWSEQRRVENLPAVVQQSRFLLLPWVRVRHLASHLLAFSAHRLRTDWEVRYGRRPLLIETLVDIRRYQGTCYRAANWIDLGLTAGRGRTDGAHAGAPAHPKRLFIYPLHRKAAELLAAGRKWNEGETALAEPNGQERVARGGGGWGRGLRFTSS